MIIGNMPVSDDGLCFSIVAGHRGVPLPILGHR